MVYLFLNLIFLSAIGLVLMLFINRRPHPALWYTLAAILCLTAIFDSIFIILGIFEYEPSKILGLAIWKAPIEDFAYAVASVFIVGLLWDYFENKEARDEA